MIQWSSARTAFVVCCLYSSAMITSCSDEVVPPSADTLPTADVGSTDRTIPNIDLGDDVGADSGPADLLAEAIPDGCTKCTQDAQCDDGDACTKETCGASGCCQSAPSPAGGGCDDQELCTKGDACDGKGTCVGVQYSCIPGKCEATSVCDGKGGCGPTFLVKGAVCDDGNACTKADTCDGKGGCAGSSYACAPKQCEAASVCDGKGGCLSTPKPATTVCVDGYPCTKNDACDGKGKCAGTKYGCVVGQCETSSACDGKGGCATVNMASGVTCDDKDICTSGDACDGKGKCAGVSCGSKDGYLNVYQCSGHSIHHMFRIHKCTSTGCTYKDIGKSVASCARTCSSWCNAGASTCGNAPAGTILGGCVCDGKGKCKPNPLKNDLVAYWKLDENKGSTASDSSGNGNHGTLKSPAWTTGKAYSALDFNGSSDLVTCGNGAAFGKITSELSLAAWFRLDVDPYSISQSRSYIIDKGLAWRLWYSASGEGSSTADHLFFDIWDWQGTVTKGITWKKGSWYHVVATYDGSQARLYIDGKLNNSTSVSKKLRTSGYKVLLGADSEYGGSKYHWNGALDEVAVWSRALSASEAASLYQAGGEVK